MAHFALDLELESDPREQYVRSRSPYHLHLGCTFTAFTKFVERSTRIEMQAWPGWWHTEECGWKEIKEDGSL